MHRLPIRCRAHDMVIVSIEAVVLYAHGEVALVVAWVIWVTCVEAECGVCFRAHAVA